MHKSLITTHKFIEIYSDGCVQTNYLTPDISKQPKKLIIYKKDHKLFQKLSKNKSLVKKTNNYRNKIF
jgi:hypothetical protein